MTRSDNCFICGGQPQNLPDSDYRRCDGCGHQTLAEDPGRQFIVNDSLVDADGFDVRDRFQRNVAREAAVEDELLVDVGCGSGRFLRFNKDAFADHLGIEVTPECVEFARRRWGLKVETSLPALSRPPSLVTCWHSLEHIPADEIAGLLDKIRAAAAPATRVVVCVPNAASWQAALFGRRWTYYDVPAHLHQFTPGSLERLMVGRGFAKGTERYSFIYSFAGWLLSFVNLVTPQHNYFYYRRKRGRISQFGAAATVALDVACLIVAACAAVPSASLALLELAAPRSRSVITVEFAPRA